MERLKELRSLKRLRQKDVAEILGIDRTTYVKYENGASEPDKAMMLKLADFFNVTVDYLLGRNENISNAFSPTRIPVYGNIAAGIPIEAIVDYDLNNAEDWEEISEELARNGSYIALRIKGSSMEPRMKTGDVVIVRVQPDVENGDIAAVQVNGDEVTCKKVHKTSDGLMLVPLNTEYDTQFYSSQQIIELPVVILGKVVELRAKF